MESGTKLSGKIYTVWKMTMHSALLARDLWRFCEVKDIKEESKMKNAEAKSLILNAIEDSQKARVENCDTAHDLWVKIQDTLEGSKPSLQTRTLQEFLNIKLEPDESLQDYCGRYEELLNKLLSTGYEMEKNTKLWAFKNSLQDNLYEKCDTWEIIKENLKILDLITLMRSRDRKLAPINVALVTKQEKFKHTGQAGRLANIECNYCKKKGHKWRDCRKKKAVEKKKPSIDLQTDQAYAINPFKVEPMEDSGIVSMWIVDSGSTRHMTPNRSELQHYTAFDEPHKIFIGNGDTIESIGFGQTYFRGGNGIAKLAKVLWTPELSVRRFSVHQCMRQGLSVLFVEDRVEIRRGKDIELVGRQNSQGLYVLKLNMVGPCEQNDSALLGLPLSEWHKKFAHVNRKAIRELARKGAVIGLEITKQDDEECIDCAMCKLVRVSHPRREEKPALQNKSVLHVDTCGPKETASLGFNRYFVLATDQNSGFKLIKFVKTKDEVANAVKDIVRDAELYSKQTVSMICSDNGSEYKNRHLGEWLRHKSIAQEFSTPYVPQQNGLAEQSNRTVIEGVRTLLKSSSLPETLWCEAANTIVYVWNRTLSKDGEVTRFEQFTGVKPSVRHFRIFGQYAVSQIPSHMRSSEWSPPGRILRFVGVVQPRAHLGASNTSLLFTSAATHNDRNATISTVSSSSVSRRQNKPSNSNFCRKNFEIS